MNGGLEIATDLSLPLEAVTETFAILAKRGKGKTNTAVVLAEELLAAGLPVVVLDPVGVWWGIRSSADGKGPGLPVVIFGGDHADVPLEEHAGELIADVIVDKRVPAVIDLSGLSKAAARRFMAPFLERLYHRNREPLHVIIDEADTFAPQRARAEGARLLGAMEDLVRRGRARGLGASMISQRPATLAKDVLTQAEVLIALGMTGPRDVAAIDEWVRLHAEEDQARQVKASLPTLGVGDAWVWSPGWLDILQRVHVRARRTFDSSATPKPGQRRISPTRMAEVDLEALGAQIAATREQAQAADPTALRRRIRELEAQLASERARTLEPVVETVEVRVEVPVVPPELAKAFAGRAGELIELLTHIDQKLGQHRPEPTSRPAPDVRPRSPQPSLATSERRRGSPPSTVPAPASTSGARGAANPGADRPGARGPSVDGSQRLPKAQRKILTALAQYGPRATTQVAVLTGYSHKSGGFRNSLSTLRTAGHITGHGEVTITDAGREALGDAEPLPTGAELLGYWRENHLGKCEKAIVAVLEQHGGGPVEIPQVAEEAGYSPSSGGFRNSVSRLRSLQLASGRGELTLNPELLLW